MCRVFQCWGNGVVRATLLAFEGHCSQTRILWGIVLCIRWEIMLCGTTDCYIWQKCFSRNHTYWNYLLTYITTSLVCVPLLIWRDVTKSVLKLPLNPNQPPVLMTSAGFGLGVFWPWHLGPHHGPCVRNGLNAALDLVWWELFNAVLFCTPRFSGCLHRCGELIFVISEWWLGTLGHALNVFLVWNMSVYGSYTQGIVPSL